MDWSSSKWSLLPVYLCCFFSFIFTASSAFNVSTISFDEGYSHLFGEGNLVRSPDGRNARLILNRASGAGFISSRLYNHGFFSAMIKLPSYYTAGICVAFYTSNADVFEKTHDELDFEFLGNVAGKPWRFQTNFYGNGSTHRGREERYRLWFDPSKEYHRYSILWTANNIIFYIDEVPIREVVRTPAMGSDFPSKPMSLYATIWDASSWATSGGRNKVNYKYGPFTAEFKELVLEGCPVDPIEEFPFKDCLNTETQLSAKEYAAILPKSRRSMRRFREHFMYYSYCYDILRYPTPLPECVIVPSEQRRFKNTGRLKFGGSQKSRKHKRDHRSEFAMVTSTSEDPDM
ncbi:probable xyloglucan endotransglucosylase/hydrolase protein 30 [Pistacia vera]|uniref:probable xyloglucan endotransglucosylase/hydrolase protein 30 n=1 Tax=Pistacia vera TaxID=55513 RepID=UPI00126303FE|nr:probable xyloglucan endotransglucosylase/hydrolase protein 30 [Pistacia vera]